MSLIVGREVDVLPLSDTSNCAPRIMLFLGAGASQFAGYLTFRTFDHLLLKPHLRAREGLPPLDSDTERFLGEVGQALKDISRPTTHDNYLWLLNNYRDFCTKFKTHAGVQRRFEKIHAQISPFSDTIKHVIDTITYTTLYHYGTQRLLDSAAGEVRDFYLQVAQLNSATSPHVQIFTTNYDLLLETLLSPLVHGEQPIPFVTGIPNCTQEGACWSPEQFSQSGLGIHLYRLHGCVAWFYHGLGDSNVYYHNLSPSLDWRSNLCVMFPGREIFPGKNPHGFAFHQLHHALLSATLAVFIGFSFRDDDVVHSLLTANAARRFPLRIVVVDPFLSESDVFRAFEDSTTRMTLPFRIPTPNHVRFCDENFGTAGSCKKVFQLIREEIANGKATQNS